MALIGENQVGNVLIFKTYPNHATMAAAVAGNNGAGFVLSADGTAPAAGKELMVGVKNYKGGITQYKLTPSRVTYGKAVLGVAAAGRVTAITGFGTIVANELYRVAITISGYGSLSAENEYVKEGFYKAKTGDTVEDVVDGLIISLARNFSRDEPRLSTTTNYTKKGAVVVKIPNNAYFTFAKSGVDTIVVTEKSDYLANYYVTGKKTNLNLNYYIGASAADGVVVSVTDTTAGSPGTGTGYQVRNLEEYLLGNRQDTFRGAGYPHNFPENYDSVLTQNYNVVNIEYFDEGRDDTMKSKKQLYICIAEAEAAFALINLVTGDINTALAGANGVVLETFSI